MVKTDNNRCKKITQNFYLQKYIEKLHKRKNYNNCSYFEQIFDICQLILFCVKDIDGHI